MTSERWLRVKALFEEASDRPPAERAAFLAGATDGDGGLCAEVERLLAADAEADAYFDTLGLAVAGGDGEERARVESVGPYRLLDAVGFGGMGAVYRARREDGQFRRDVAVKLIRRGVHSREAARRFRVERQALAALRHPNIARLYDGGVAADGQPWLAMELVDGEPVTAYCDRRRLGVGARLGLFLQVCAAVGHAHRRLVVHRDLKPSNVLVAEEDGEPVVKLLDFGLAKLLGDDHGVTVPVTAADRRLLTPAYAAPEQVAGGEVTTASDVYALGVLLYELLAGRRPDEEARAGGHDPARPSAAAARPYTVRSTHGETRTVTAEEAAAARSTTPARLGRRLRGDLDRIVLTALRHEPERRYGGAAALAADVERHLAGLPVAARPATAGYRVGAFVRRHRAGVAAGGMVALALVAGLGAALWQGRVAAAERDARAAEAARAEAALAFVVGLFEDAAPEATGGAALTVDTLLAQGVARAARLAGQPLAEAPVLDALGQIAYSLGDYARADSLHGRALALRTRHLGRGHPDAALSALRLGDVRFGLRDFDAADGLYERAHAAFEAALAPDDERTVWGLGRLAYARYNRSDDAAADSLYRLVLARTAGPGWTSRPERAGALAGLGDLALQSDRPAEAERLYREALAIRRAADGDDHPETAGLRLQLGRSLGARGRLAEAAREMVAAAAAFRRVYGEDHYTVAQAEYERGRFLADAGDVDGAERAYRTAAEVYARTLGDGHAYTAYPLRYLGELLVDAGRPAEAEVELRRALAIYATADQVEAHTADARLHLGRALAARGQTAEARGLLRQSLAAYEAAGDAEGAALARAALSAR